MLNRLLAAGIIRPTVEVGMISVASVVRELRAILVVLSIASFSH